jgi:[ribosomal protein S5]-alanine N-acetyltransferase
MLVTKFKIFPELTTDRLLLRQITSADSEAIFRLRSDRDIMKYIDRPLAESIEDAVKWIEMVNDAMQNEEGVPWAICLKEDPVKLIGSIGFWRMQKQHYRAEVGYLLDPFFHGIGYMTESINKVVDFAFTIMNFHSIEAIIDPRNIASAKTLEKSGFVREAYFKENYYWNGVFCDTAIYSKLTHVIKPVTNLPSV